MTHVTTQQTRSDTAPVSSTFLRRHSVATFVALSYASAWVLWLPLVILQYDRTPPALDSCWRYWDPPRRPRWRFCWSRGSVAAPRCGACCAGS
jgi:hypothetical protein